jgi:hypothetical protein
MKRLLRWIFHTLTAMSLLLFVAGVLLCVRSYWVEDFLQHYDGQIILSSVSFSQGSIIVNRAVGLQWLVLSSNEYLTFPVARGTSSLHRSFTCSFATKPLQTVVFASKLDETGKWVNFGYDQTLIFPIYLPIVLAAVLPLAWLRWRMRSQFQAGHCPACGYDLRASKDRCPECGMAISIA